MVAVLLIFIVLIVFAMLAEGLGVDSRDFSSDPRRSGYPVGI